MKKSVKSYFGVMRLAQIVFFTVVVAACGKMSVVEISMGDLSQEEFVDLGLPSGVKWASHNMGAALPEKTGTCFAWGCTKEYDTFNSLSHSAYKEEVMNEYPSPRKIDFENYGEAGDTLRYYVTGGDNAGEVLPATYDAVSRNFGAEFHIPSAGDFAELYANTNRQWVKFNGITGWRFTSVHNGNSIFFPATAFVYEETSGWQGLGSYWTSQGVLASREDSGVVPVPEGFFVQTEFNSPARALVFTFNDTFLHVQDYYRKSLLPIRPVKR